MLSNMVDKYKMAESLQLIFSLTPQKNTFVVSADQLLVDSLTKTEGC